ncbi:MAG: hypothetical protein L6Q73_17740 [Aquabacterium sp.]|nr:hypothetical protein [Aquabacterium sp.]
MWMMHLGFAVTAALTLPAQAAQSILVDQVAGLSVVWRSVQRCGAWKADGRAGYFRVIVGDVSDGAGSELYVQRVAHATQQQGPVVVGTASISELNDDHAQYDFQSVECRREGRSTLVQVVATFEHDEDDRRHLIALRLTDAGQYKLSRRILRGRR